MINLNYLRLFITSILLIVYKSVPIYGIKCVDCIGLDCFGPTCDGDYCMIAVYEPRTDIKNFKIGEAKIIKGCVTGTLLKQSLKDECERFDEADTTVQMCLCDDKDMCNHKIHEDKMKTEKSKLVTCLCSDCNKKTCEGEYCTYSSNENGEDVIQGCSNRSLPLIERKGEGACMTPPFSPNFIQKTLTEGYKREVCLCATNYCNSKKPAVVDSKRMKCKKSVKMTLHGLPTAEDFGECTGEHCFDVEMKEKGAAFTYAAKGCMSFIEGREMAEELNDEGCVNFTSTVIDIKACFDTNGNVNKPGKPGAQVQPKGRGGKPNKGENVKPKVEHGKPGTPAANKHHKTEAYKGAESTTEEPETSDGNTTIVVIFVVIMVIIVIAGVVWKFELHKKIFQARYQSVAG